jgi:serralysin
MANTLAGDIYVAPTKDAPMKSKSTVLILPALAAIALTGGTAHADNTPATTSEAPSTQPAPAPESAADIPMKQYETLPPQATIAAPEGVPQEITSPMGKKMTLKFDDEFDAMQDKPDGKPYFDRRKWQSSFWQGDSVRTLIGNQEAEYYTDKEYGAGGVPKERRVNPFSFEEPGVLTISAVKVPEDLWKKYYMGKERCFASGILNSDNHFDFQYGYIEGRFKLPNNRGAWPAFWLLGNDPTLGKPDTAHQWGPEIDIFEFFGHRPTKHTCGVITRSKTDGMPNKIFWHDLKDVDLTQDYHTWGFEWDDKQMVWTLDGQIWATHPTPASMNRPMYLLINLAVGGHWYSEEMRAAGTPYKPWEVDESTMPWKMKCDYVRVYQLEK